MSGKPKPKLRLIATLEYEPDPRNYPSPDPESMAEIDEAELQDRYVLAEWIEWASEVSVRVEVIS
jgi:hypothetical protein